VGGAGVVLECVRSRTRLRVARAPYRSADVGHGGRRCFTHECSFPDGVRRPPPMRTRGPAIIVHHARRHVARLLLTPEHRLWATRPRSIDVHASQSFGALRNPPGRGTKGVSHGFGRGWIDLNLSPLFAGWSARLRRAFSFAHPRNAGRRPALQLGSIRALSSG
jgi:hypothetical protein